MDISVQQIESIAPNPAAFSAGRKLSSKEQWQSFAKSERALWGAIKGSGANPYLTQIDTLAVAYKCTCPSRQFPCKHSIALMLLYTENKKLFQTAEEPEWVKAWMDKRVTKEKPKSPEVAEPSEEEIEQLEKNREKTQQNRLALVVAGAEELDLWLKDLVRIGLLELPNKSKAEFQRVAARMIDAKAPGLAGWIKSLGKINYDDEQTWQQDALHIISKLFLLTSAIRKYDTLTPLWQQTVRNLTGWSQSTKELLADGSAETVKDHWLVAGQEVETTDDEITVQRNWLIGHNSNRQGLVLTFGTKYTTIDNSILPGTVIEGEFVYFPAVLPQRGAFKIQRRVADTLESQPASFESWRLVHEYKVHQMKVNPWINDIIITLRNARLVNHGPAWIVCDEERFYMPVVYTYDFTRIMKWLAISGNRQMNMALIIRNNSAVPLGVFDENKYIVL